MGRKIYITQQAYVEDIKNVNRWENRNGSIKALGYKGIIKGTTRDVRHEVRQRVDS